MTFNLFLLCGAMGTLVERAQRRARPRVAVNEPVTVVGAFGEKDAVLLDANELGVLLRVLDGSSLDDFAIRAGDELLPAVAIKGAAVRVAGECAARYCLETPAQERAAVRLAFGSSERWCRNWAEREAPRNFVMSIMVLLGVFLEGAAEHVRQLNRRQSEPLPRMDAEPVAKPVALTEAIVTPVASTLPIAKPVSLTIRPAWVAAPGAHRHAKEQVDVEMEAEAFYG